MQKKLSISISILIAISVATIFLLCDLGKQPIGPDVMQIGEEVDPIFIDTVTEWEYGTMEIYVDPSELPASNNKTAKVTVRLYNLSHNPIVGREIFFATTHGVIESNDTTDETGTAEVTFTSEPINIEVSVYAWMFDIHSNKVTVMQRITLSGIDISIFSVSNVLINATVPVTVFVTDADGKSIANRPVFLSGGIVDTLMTMGNGTVQTSVTRATEGIVAIRAESQGAYASDTVKFWVTIPDTVIDTVETIRKLRIFSSKAQLDADNTDYAVITAILINENNNPAVGDSIQFFSDLGIIEEFAVIDSTGRTSVILRSAPVNGICTIRAMAVGRLDTASTKITFSGVSLQLIADPTDLKTGEYSTIEAFLSDASGNAIEGDPVTFTVTGGVFENDSTMQTVVLNTNGIAGVRVTSGIAGAVLIRASALNCIDSTTVSFSNNILTLIASPGIIAVGGASYSTITATYRDANNNLVSGAWIHFYTNAGTIGADSVPTVNGVAVTTLQSADFATVATVKAIAPNGTAAITVEFAAINAANIDLKVSPDNIGVNGGVATLTATVTDVKNNMVSGAPVNFKILVGPGGEEYIDKTVVTTKDGIARSHLHAGSIPSQYRACEIAASVGTISDTSKMTISGEPYVVTVARPQDDTVVVTDAGQINPSTFTFNAGAVIQDVNGNNVADGMEVHFSAVISGLAVARKRFVRWEVSLTEIKPIIAYDVIHVPFEDINNNFNMDQNIDLDLDDYPLIASRGDDVDGDGIMEYNYHTHDLFFDFNFNGVCDIYKSEPHYDIIYVTDITGYDTTMDVVGQDTVGYDTTLSNPSVDTIITPYWNFDSTVILYDTTIFIAYDTTITPITSPILDTTITPITDIVDSTCIFFADLNNNGVWDKTELWRDHNGNQICDMPADGDFQWWRWEMRPQFHGIRFDFHTNDFAVVIASSAVTKDGVAEAGITYPRQMANRLIVSINAEINGIRDRDGERFALPILIKGK